MPDQIPPNVDLAIWLDAPNETLLVDRAELALQVATGWAQSYTQQRLVPVVGDVVSLDVPYGTQELWLPERPVSSITSVTILGVPLVSPTDWVRIGSSRLRAKRWTYWPTDDPVVTTYSHGYAVADQTIRGVVLSAAARILDNPAMLQTSNVGGIQATMAEPGAGLTASEQAALWPYRAVEAVA